MLMPKPQRQVNLRQAMLHLMHQDSLYSCTLINVAGKAAPCVLLHKPLCCGSAVCFSCNA
jgi:hypothetical protein